MTKKKRSYRESIEEVEAILEDIETGDVNIDDLADKIKSAAEILQECKDKLFRTEQEIEKILKST